MKSSLSFLYVFFLTAFLHISGIVYGQDSTNNLTPQPKSTFRVTGWVAVAPPVVKDYSTEEGKIVAQMTIDSTGRVVKVTTIECTLSKETEKVYLDGFANMLFKKTQPETKPAEFSTGTVTLIIKAR